MKFLTMLVPVLLLLVFMRFTSGALATGSVNPLMLIGISALFLVGLMFFRPKKNAKPASDLEKKARGEFAKDAFGDEARIRLEASDEHRLTEAMLSMLIVKTLPSQVALFAPNPLYAEGMKSRAAELPAKLNAAIIKMALEKKKESALFLKRRASDSSQG